MKRIFCLLMVILLSAAALAACAQGEAPVTPADDTTDVQTTGNAESDETVINWESAGLPTEDFEGRGFHILYSGTITAGQTWRFIDVEELTGEILNDAIYQRNSKIEEIYNIAIDTYYSGNFQNDLKNSVSAADGAYDTAFGPANTLISLAQTGHLLNWNKLPYVDLDAQWWDKSVIEGLSFYDKLYMCTGDISPLTNIRVYSLVFNKDLCRDLGLDLPYQHVLDGNWTIDVFSEYIANVNRDVNGDSVMDYEDVWGYFSQDGNSYMMYFSGGGRIAEKNNEGEPVLVFNNDKYIDLAVKALEISFDKNKTLMANAYVTNNGGQWSAASSWFAAGGSLMRSSVFEPVPRDYRAMDTDFGILPYPKLDESQETYYTLPEITSMMFCVPMTASADYTGIILESLAAESVSSVTHAFYEVCLKGKTVRDNESEAMLDIIFGNKIFDIGYFLDLASFTNTLTTLEKAASVDVASKYESILGNAQKQLDKFIEQYKALE
jgi:ABC-type glycerol-3-phosphate transport system substrate-binding protein